MNVPQALPLFALLGLAFSSVASATDVKPFKTETTVAPTVVNMSTLLHQKTLGFPPHEMHAENPKIRFHLEPKNNLQAGGINDVIRPTHLNQRFPAVGFTGWHPPDCDTAIGPKNIIVTVNVAVAIYDKKGNQIGNTVDLGVFFSGQKKATFVFDPCSFYDPGSQRYFVAADVQSSASNVSQEVIAVSATSDPTGNWYKYGVDTGQTINSKAFWMDYPHFGLSTTGVAFAGNMFSFDGTAYNGCQLVSMRKSDFLTGAPLTVSYFTQPNLGTIQPSRDFLQTTSTIYGLGVESSTTLDVIAITSPGKSPVLTTTTVAIPFMSAPTQDAVAPQGHYLDGFVGDGRLYNCDYINGHLVAAHNINGANNRIAVRWYDVLANSYPASKPTLLQAGTIPAPANEDAFMPAISMNVRGDIGIVYSRSGDNLAPQMMFASRYPFDASGTVSTPVVLANSLASTYGTSGFNRWGDYFGIQIDPNDNKTFYVYGMVAGADTNWLTVVGNVTVDTMNDGANAISIAKIEGGSPSGTVADTYAVDASAYSIPSAFEGGLGQVASAEMLFKLDAPTGVLQSGQLAFTVLASSGISNLVYFYNWNSGNWDNVSAAPLSSSYNSTGVGLTADQVRMYTSSTNQVKVRFRAISPQHVTNGSTPFTFKINQVQFTRQSL